MTLRAVIGVVTSLDREYVVWRFSGFEELDKFLPNPEVRRQELAIVRLGTVRRGFRLVVWRETSSSARHVTRAIEQYMLSVC